MYVCTMYATWDAFMYDVCVFGCFYVCKYYEGMRMCLSAHARFIFARLKLNSVSVAVLRL